MQNNICSQTRILTVVRCAPLLVSLFFIAGAASSESISSYSLDKLNQEIASCYQTGKLLRAAILYKRALVLIEKSGNKKALTEAQANYKKLVDRLARMDTNNSEGPASTSSVPTASATDKQPKKKAEYDSESGFEKADEAWRKRLDQHSKQYKAYDLDQQARQHSASGANTKALATISDALKLCPELAGLWYNKGLIEITLSKWDDAATSFRKAQSLSPEMTFKCQLRHADIAVESGNYAKASELLWKLRPEARSDFSAEREIDGMLVQACDERAIANGSILSNATERNLTVAIKASAETSKTHILKELCKALQTRGHDASNELFMAYYLSKAGLYEESLAAYRRADEYAPSDKKGLIGILSLASQLGKLEEVQAARIAFVDRFPSDERTKSYREAIAYYNEDFQKTRVREKQPSSDQADRPHFAPTEMPLKVFVPNVETSTSSWVEPPDPNLDYEGILLRVMDDWSQATLNKVRFEKVQSVETSNISIEWVGDKEQMDHTFAAGTTGYVQDSKGRVRHCVKILAPQKSAPTNSQQLYEVALHEFGHALGLSHSSAPEDIMYHSSANGQTALSENDRKRIQELYK